MAGNLFVRDKGYDMVATADEVVAILREACRAAEDMGMKIAMENHADFTVRELASIHAAGQQSGLRFYARLRNLAFDLDNPLRLAEILAPHALTTHFKNYRIIRTGEGLALQNGALGDGDIDLPAIAATLAKYNPEINLNIEIHSQFAPFKLEHAQPGLLGAPSLAAGRRFGVVFGEGLGPAAAGSLAREPAGRGGGMAARRPRIFARSHSLGAGASWLE